jgi:regulator of sirC expression with transglutaminase-like and TPR domain
MAIGRDNRVIRIAQTLFELESTQFDGASVRKARNEFETLVMILAAKRLPTFATWRQASCLSRFLYRTRGFRWRPERTSERFTLTGTLLNRGGSCLGLTTLYCCLGGRLSLPLCPILFEGHIVVGHYGVDPPLYLETTRGGAVFPERLITRLHGPLLCPAPLSDGEFLAVHLSSRAAFVCAPAGNVNEAFRWLQTAVELYPQYAAAWINRSKLSLDLGDHVSAAESLSRAVNSSPRGGYRRMVAALQKRLACEWL